VSRTIYTSEEKNKLPGKIIRREGQDAVADISANEVYDYFKQTFDFYNDVFGRYSIDNRGMQLIGSIHFDDIPGPPGYDNAFWDGEQMIFGDGDGIYFGSFTKNLDVIAHELTHGVTSHEANFPYFGQSGALNESVSDVFGSMVKQYALGKQEAKDADWLIGEGIFTPSINGVALRSMKAPGTAYDDSALGKDPQPANMKDYVQMDDDNGGVHINSGIPNHAFYLVAIALGGHSWDRAGNIWYQTIKDRTLRNADEVTFKLFADVTCKHALDLYGNDVQEVVKKAWSDVGVYTAEETSRL
jgi:Zn-dependent metalloprotease